MGARIRAVKPLSTAGLQGLAPAHLPNQVSEAHRLDMSIASDTNAPRRAHTRQVHWDEARRLFSRALAGGGARKGWTTCEWDIAGSCERPYLRVTVGRPRTEGERFFIVKRGKTRTRLEVHMWLPCSQCPSCRRRIAAKWRERAKHELRVSARTWFGTLTFRPSERYRLMAKASQAYGPGFEGLPERHRFRLIEREAYQEAQKYWKKLRKNTGMRLRYIMVAEAHRDGSLHYHALVHERAGMEIRHAQLSANWWHGFTKWKLVETGDHVARYVTKYLTKDSQTRTRASVGYGQFSPLQVGGTKDAERNYGSKGEPDHSNSSLSFDSRKEREGGNLSTDLNGGLQDGTCLSSRECASGDYRGRSTSSSSATAGNAGVQTFSNERPFMAGSEALKRQYPPRWWGAGPRSWP